MAIVDSKGRLFSKINIIDLAVILVVILGVVIFVRYMYFPSSSYEVKDTRIIGIQTNVFYLNWTDLAGEQGSYFKILNVTFFSTPKEIVTSNGTYFLVNSLTERDYSYLIELKECRRKKSESFLQYFICYEADKGYTPLYDERGKKIFIYKGSQIPLINERISLDVVVKEIVDIK